MIGTLYPNRISAGRQHEPISVGNYILQLQPQHGYRIDPAPAPTPLHWARAIPLDLQTPPPPAVIFGREREIHAASLALHDGRSVELFGPQGIGKTALLRYLAQQATRTGFGDGVVYLSVHGQSADDLQQIIYHAFLENQSPYHPDALHIRQDLHHKRVLVVLDDVDLSSDALLTLLNTLDNCTFLIASATRRLAPERNGISIPIGALPPNEALALLEHELNRTLRADEKGLANMLCSVMDGNPLRIIQAVALTRERGRTLARVVDDLTLRQPIDALHEQIIDKLSEVEREIVHALALFDRVPLHIAHLHALVDASDMAGALNKLQQRGIVQSDGSSFRLNGGLSTLIRRRHDLSAHYTRALEHFSKWATHRTHTTLPEAPALLELMTWAASTARWPQLLTFYAAIEDVLVLSQRWGAWESALQLALPAARAQKDRASEARLLHQLGTRALCLGRASHPLISALRLREMLRDKEGVEVTQHNLEMQLGRSKPRRSTPPPSLWRRFATTIGPLAAVITGILILIWWPRTQPTDNTPQVAQQTPTIVPPTATPMPTLPPPTPTATATNLPESDLVIQNFKVIPEPVTNTDRSVDVPVQFDINNTGLGDADGITVTFNVIGSPAQTVNFQPDNDMMPNVPAGQITSYKGRLNLVEEYAGEIISIVAEVHNCAAQASTANCPSIEKNTANNQSQEVLYTPPKVWYDFVATGIARAPVEQATWHGEPAGIGSAAVPLELNNSVNEMRGSTFIHNRFRADQGEQIEHALVMQPAQGRMGTVVGRYSFPDTLQAGDYLVVQVGLHESARQADLQFIVEFYNRNPNLGHFRIAEVRRKYGDGMIYCEFKIPFDLAGESGFFQLTVRGNTESSNDLAVWEMARLMRQP